MGLNRASPAISSDGERRILVGLIATKAGYYVATNGMLREACYGKCQHIRAGTIGIADHQWCAHRRINRLGRYVRQLIGGPYAVRFQP